MVLPRTTGRGRVIAHRGASGHAPENTLAAFREAARRGACWVEFDAALLADGELIIHHDATLDRCTDGSGRVRLQTFPDVTRLDAGAWFGAEFVGERLPTLETALDEIARLGLSANLEIKINEGEGEESALAVVNRLKSRSDLDGRLLVTSFDHGALAVVREHLPDVPMGLLYEKPASDWKAVADRLRACSLHIQVKYLDGDLIDAAVAADRELRVYTANRREDVTDYWPERLLGVITNYPERFLGDLAE